jgi:hypothetical protein
VWVVIPMRSPGRAGTRDSGSLSFDAPPRRSGLPAAGALALLVCGLACGGEPLGSRPTPPDAGLDLPPYRGRLNTNVDLLFMIDDSSQMTPMQEKLLAQLPTFMQVLQALPTGLPSLHVGVISSDLGAPSDASIVGCTATGDNGHFFTMPEGSCGSNEFTAATDGYVTDDAAGTTKNFTAPDPAGISTTLRCIGLLGSSGCGFPHQLASIDRALGADGQPPPDPSFLRPDAYLAIVILTDQDDCSAPASTTPLPIYSLGDGSTNGLSAPDGPLTRYRCNGGPLGGHLCQDLTPGSSSQAYAQPPLIPPPDTTGTAAAPTLTLSNCVSNDTPSSGLIPVAKLAADIQALKVDPEGQILVAAIAGPAAPYAVQWSPGSGPAFQELWPEIEHSCVSPTGDGSFGDPSVRIAQFVQAFGDNGLLASICDDDYAGTMISIAARISRMIGSNCPAGSPCP